MGQDQEHEDRPGGVGRLQVADPDGPTFKMSTAKMGNKKVAPPKSTAKRSRVIVARIGLCRQTKTTPAQRLFQEISSASGRLSALRRGSAEREEHGQEPADDDDRQGQGRARRQFRRREAGKNETLRRRSGRPGRGQSRGRPERCCCSR